jgi:murein DD-endopeptidase MepM/ murein hydrolase activator NlpD
LFSTLLSAAVGALAILVVVIGSRDMREGSASACKTVMCWFDAPSRTASMAPMSVDGLRWASPKADRLQVTSKSPATRYFIHQPIRQMHGGRQRIAYRPFARIVARLAAIPARADLQLPPFNPFSLYASPSHVEASIGSHERSWGNVVARVVDLVSGLLPIEDGQELDDTEVIQIVSRAQDTAADLPGMRPSFTPDGAERLVRSLATAQPGEIPPHTTVIAKSFSESDSPTEDIDGRQVRRLKSVRGDTPSRLLLRAGADPRAARAIMDAAKGLLSDAELEVNHEAVVTLAPSVTAEGRLEPVSFSLYTPSNEHRLSVARSAAGELVASEVPLTTDAALPPTEETAPTSSLYSSIYRAGLIHSISPETIEVLLHVFATDTDYRRRVQPSDLMEVFFDLKDDERGAMSPSAELLYASLSSSSSSPRFWRFRTHDGAVDYYDESGNNSRKFLIRQPVRYEDVRLSSGFGYRMHPLLGYRKMHTGVDLAVPNGTPILAAGNGVVEEAKWKGEYGNYVRIRHSNGYQTAYGHMSRIAAGMREGVRVTQGQVIGFVGSTGQASGPHLHYEVLVNNERIDPLQMKVPRERRLIGQELAEFQKERTRIDDLMHLRPVRVEQLDSGQ